MTEPLNASVQPIEQKVTHFIHWLLLAVRGDQEGPTAIGQPLTKKEVERFRVSPALAKKA